MTRRPPRSPAEIAAQIEQARSSQHRLGTILSLSGAAILAVILVVLIGGGLIIASAGAPGTLDRGAGISRDTREAIQAAMLLVPTLLILFAVCGLVPGEQLRRGSMQVQDLPRAGTGPTGTIGSRFRPLGYGWHALWAGLGLVVSAALVMVPAASWITGGWPYADRYGDDALQLWVIWGALGVGVSVAAWVSLLKKAVWTAGTRHRTLDQRQNDPHRRFWRWLTYRWRLDLWLAGLGGTAIAISVTVAASESGTDTGPMPPAAAFTLGGGLLLVVVGCLLATQFWRSGESIGSAEGAT